MDFASFEQEIHQGAQDWAGHDPDDPSAVEADGVGHGHGLEFGYGQEGYLGQ